MGFMSCEEGGRDQRVYGAISLRMCHLREREMNRPECNKIDSITNRRSAMKRFAAHWRRISRV